jgi:hypothetical protein
MEPADPYTGYQSRASNGMRIQEGNVTMNIRGSILATGALIGALALASATPTQAAEGRNAAFAAGVAAGALGGAALGGGYAAPAYGYPAYGYPAYGYGPGPAYYAGPRYARPYYRGRHRYHYYH